MAQMLVEVVGMKAFKGVIDGKSMDSGVFYSMVRLDERFNKPGENFKSGNAIEEWKLGSSELVFRIAHLKPSKDNPVLMRLEVERVSNGKETKELVMDALPVERPAARPAAPAAVVKPAVAA
jgi:hypothetical protein